ncbi:MAG TPA: SulP family inorganic anion transporter [Thiobacillus sp.]|nr:MAG: sodium-independent anion transporter [Hydrogenophilales bacterium 28-61-11]OYZ58126.1 MAG: sodium-independent anion transporter [Hydrogenophilales bacterium 16-61-112]OZA45540.1 MAG: sodium-independent anion transporter [Hydrogenophilales bacterium 17-61-76]HQT29762.1 SulP family inorganic anion transporter [Thiobacillus sp.]HQT70393.1 SulP family inorganic anion transporter [Thiobacillus sp.]
MSNTLAKFAQVCPLWVYKLFPFLRWWPTVDAGTARTDAMAGLTGALIVLPQGVAFATIAGLPPEYGLYAAMVPAIIGALWGSSWHLVSGPTTAISIAVFASVSPFATPGSPEFISMVLTLTFMAGVFQLILGLARMGVLVNFISHTVVIGFTAGAAMLIAGSQIKNFFGLAIPRGTPFFETLSLFGHHIGDIDPYVTAVAATTLISGILVKRFFPKFPYMIAAMLVGSFLALFLNNHYGVDVTHIKTVGALPAGLPPLSAPDLSFDALQQMLFPALIITMLALTEAVSISRAIATKSGQHIDGNQEFVGQGLSNLVGSFFSSYASSGSFNRSGVNYAAGARTPLAAVFASLFLVVILLLVAPLAAYLPNAAMAGILFLVAWGLIDFHHISLLPKINKQETIVLWVTLIGTLIDLEKGIFFGIALSLIFYLYRTSRPVLEPVLPDPDPTNHHYGPLEGRKECPQVKMMRLHGSIFFGAVAHLQQQLQVLEENEPERKHLVIMASGINFVDLAGAEFLAEAARQRRKIGGKLYFYRMKDSIHETLKRGHFMDDIGEENLFPAKIRPMSVIYANLDNEICRNCPVRAFPVCQTHLPNGEARTS